MFLCIWILSFILYFFFFMKIYLTGFMGSGKNTVGRILASQLGWPFRDLDSDIETAAGKSISSIFEEDGEEKFRQLETQALHRVVTDPAVISTGGGSFIFNRDWMLQNGTVVYLDVPFEVLTQRITAESSRPLWKNAEKLFKERSDQYRMAHFMVDANRSAAEVATDIRKLLRDKLDEKR
jgi:shikimate kinase